MAGLGRKVGVWSTHKGAVYDAHRKLGAQTATNVDFKIVKVVGGYTWQTYEPGVCVSDIFYPIERRIYAEVFVTPHSLKELEQIVFRYSGGEWSNKSLSVHLSNLNAKLAILGQRVVIFRRRDNTYFYRVEFTSTRRKE